MVFKRALQQRLWKHRNQRTEQTPKEQGTPKEPTQYQQCSCKCITIQRILCYVFLRSAIFGAWLHHQFPIKVVFNNAPEKTTSHLQNLIKNKTPSPFLFSVGYSRRWGEGVRGFRRKHSRRRAPPDAQTSNQAGARRRKVFKTLLL